MNAPKESRFYGGSGTIHGTELVNVEVRNGKVVSVWFRCCALPFDQTDVDKERASDMERMYVDVNAKVKLVGVQIEDKS